MKDETERIQKRRLELQDKSRLVTRAYIEKNPTGEDYTRQVRLIKEELESLVLPEVTAAEETVHSSSACPNYGL